MGSYPKISLKEARKRYVTSYAEVVQGKIPNPYWKNKKTLKKTLFKDYSIKYVNEKSVEWKNTLTIYAFPVLGNKEIKEIETKDILAVLQPVWNNKTETANRLRGRIEKILSKATSENLRTGLNPAQWQNHLCNILPNPKKLAKVSHHKAMDYLELPQFIKMIHGKQDSISYLALEFLILTGCRSGEVRFAKHEEVENAIWTIPSNRMKMGKEHRVPLIPRCLELINIAKVFDSNSTYLFSNKGKPLSDSTLSKLLKAKNIEATPHGFRSSFRDYISEETNHSRDVVEMCLAHQIPSETERAYRRKDLFKKRKSCMKDWGDYCLTGRIQNVFPIVA